MRSDIGSCNKTFYCTFVGLLGLFTIKLPESANLDILHQNTPVENYQFSPILLSVYATMQQLSGFHRNTLQITHISEKNDTEVKEIIC